MKIKAVCSLVLILLGCFWGVQPACGAPGEEEELVVITLAENAAVQGGQILLGEIGEISGPAEAVSTIKGVSAGTAPLPGNSRRLTWGHIEVRLRQAGIDLKKVELRGATSVQVYGAGELPLSTSEKDWDWTSQVVVVTRDVARGEILARADLAVQEREGSAGLRDEGSLADFLGLRATRYLKKGTVLNSLSAEPVPVVERGAQVRIVAVQASICVSAPGTARGTGNRGDLIPVENALSRQIVYAEIIDENTVQVRIGGSRQDEGG